MDITMKRSVSLAILMVMFLSATPAADEGLAGRWHGRTQNSQGGAPLDFTLGTPQDMTYTGTGHATGGTGLVKVDLPITVSLTQTGDTVRGAISYKERAWGRDCVGQIVVDGVREGDVVTGSTLEDISCGKNSVRGGTIRLERLPEAKARKTNPKDGLVYVQIPAGTLLTVCMAKETNCSPHELAAAPFWMGETEVSQAAYERVTGANPSHYKGANRPVEDVSWDEAASFCRATGMRLPTIQEWEYAAHGGKAGGRYDDLNDVAHYWGNHVNMGTHEVGLKEPNAYGLYDMLGNVWEWTADLDTAGKYRVRLGGSWFEGEKEVSASSRYSLPWRISDDRSGFRCVGE
jgi:hypothetical protein